MSVEKIKKNSRFAEQKPLNQFIEGQKFDTQFDI